MPSGITLLPLIRAVKWGAALLCPMLPLPHRDLIAEASYGFNRAREGVEEAW